MKTSAFMLACFRRRSFWSTGVRFASHASNWRVALTTFMRATIAVREWEVKWRKLSPRRHGDTEKPADETRRIRKKCRGVFSAPLCLRGEMRTGATAELVSPDLAPVCAPRGASLVEMGCVGFDKALLVL